MKYSLCLITILASLQVVSQSNDRLRPGKLYNQGEEIYAPRVGVKSIIPKGWAGMVPQGAEVFLLMPQNGEGGEIYAASNFDDDLESAKSRWAEGVIIVNNIKVKSTEKSGMRGEDTYFSELEIIQHPGIKTSGRAYAEIKCGKYGNCVGVLLVYRGGSYESQKAAVTDFVENMQFVEPQDGDIYADFNWSEFLQTKYLTNFRYTDTSGKQNEIWLCSDGTFRSDIKRKGLAKAGDKDIRGKKKGTWRAEGTGPMGTLYLKINKTDEEAPIELRVEEDKFYSVSSGERVYIMENFECKSN